MISGEGSSGGRLRVSVTPLRTPTTGEIAGRPITLTYTSLAAEYEILHTRAAVIDRSHRGRTRFRGDGAPATLSGLLTNDIEALAPGHGCYAAALNGKGKVVADVRVFRDEDSLLVDVPPRAFEGWTSLLRKYVNPRAAKVTDESESMRCIGVFGPTARLVVAELTGGSAAGLGVLPPYSHALALISGTPVVVAHVPDGGIEGFDLFIPAAAYEDFWARAVASGGAPVGHSAWEVARVEAGRPEWGIDMDDMTLAQEANLEALHAISFTKGCYIGQEVVARIHFRGHVNKLLRGLRAAEAEPPESGATLLDAEARNVGDVRSGVSSPRLGGIALGMVRRGIEPGTPLTARSDGRECRVEVTPLPFAG
jgi:tRNA-modifying protein YgfZ